MSYAVKEIFKTLQGEGGQVGRVAVFCRFSGCNLWSGRESDRSRAVDLVATIAETWGPAEARRFVVLTGGEPLLQVDEALVAALHAAGFEIAIETNGTIEPPAGLDWICVSPKGGTVLVVTAGHELKLVYPQAEAPPEAFTGLAFERFLLQPMDGPDVRTNTEATIAYCLDHPQWRLSVQTHKQAGFR